MQEPALVGLVWPDLNVWVSPWHWEAMEGTCLGEEAVPWALCGGQGRCPGRSDSILDPLGTGWANLGGVLDTAGSGLMMK